MTESVKVKPDKSVGAIKIALDAVSDIFYPIYKMAFGVDGSVTNVSATNPLPVVVDATTAIEVSGLPVTPFGELNVSEMTPKAQILGTHGFGSTVESFAFNGGSATTVDGEFSLSTGTNVGAFAAVVSKRSLNYKPGDGVTSMFTCRFNTPASQSTQKAGLINLGNSLSFGYNNLDFGFFHEHGGYSELRLLTVTTASTGAANATIEVDGTSHSIALTNNADINITAAEIAEGLNAADAVNAYTANQEIVTARFGAIGPKTGLFTFTHATAVAGWTTEKTGIASTSDFTAQTSWNLDVMDGTGSSGVTMGSGGDLNPTDGGFIGRVEFQYLGYGNILVSIADPNNVASFFPVHIVRWLKDGSTGVNMSSPSYRIGYSIASQGSTTDMTLRGASASLFHNGKYVNPEESRSESVTLTTIATATEHHVMSVRCATHRGGRSSGDELLPLLLKYGSESNKGVNFKIYKNVGTWGTNLIFDYKDVTGSIAEISTTTTTFSSLGSGKLIAVGTLLLKGTDQINLKELKTFLTQGDTLSITVEHTNEANKDANASLIWEEDL